MRRAARDAGQVRNPEATEQWDAVDYFVRVLSNRSDVLALFLKGSLARGEEDKHSDVDFYCIIDESAAERFSAERGEILASYRKPLFIEEVYFVAPQIVCVFDDGLHFDLYTMTQQTIVTTDHALVLHDPHGVMEDYKPEPLGLSSAEVANLVNEFAFGLLEFMTAYSRSDLLWATRVGSNCFGVAGGILRYVYDTEWSKLGMKRLEKKLPKGLRDRLRVAMDGCHPSALPAGVQDLASVVLEVVEGLPMEVQVNIQNEFLTEMAGKIIRLRE